MKTPSRCGVCRSYDIMPEQEYQDIRETCINIDADNPRIRLAILRAILEHRGIRIAPISTLNLCEDILDDNWEELPVGATIMPDGRIFYHKRRVKRQEGS